MTTINNVRCFTLVLLFLMPAVLQALSRDEARKAAVENSVAVRQAGLSLESDEITRRVFNYKYLPQLSGSISGSYPFLSSSGSTSGASVGAAASLQESVTIFSGGLQRLDRELLNITTAGLKQNEIAAVYAALDAADSGYYDCLAAEASLEAAQVSLNVAKAAWESSEIRYNNGLLGRADYLQSQAQKASAENSVLQARRSLELSKLSLSRVTGIDDVGELEAIGFDAYEDFAKKLAALDEAGVERAAGKIKAAFMEKNPEQQTAALALSRAENSLAQTKAGWYPTITAGAGLSAGYGLGFGGGFTRSPSYSGSASVNIAVPLDFWTQAADVKRQKIELEKARLSYQDAQAGYDVEIRSACHNIAMSAATVLSSRLAEELAKLRLDSASELFRLGSASVSNLLDASSDYSQAAGAKASAEYDFFRALSAIRTLTVTENEAALFSLFTE